MNMLAIANIIRKHLMVACMSRQSSFHAVFLLNASDHTYKFDVACSVAAIAHI